MPAEIGRVQNEEHRIGPGDSVNPSREDIVSHLLVFRPRGKTIDAGQVNQVHYARTIDARTANMLLDCYARKVCDFLAQARDPVEERRFAGIGRSYESNRVTAGVTVWAGVAV